MAARAIAGLPRCYEQAFGARAVSPAPSSVKKVAPVQCTEPPMVLPRRSPVLDLMKTEPLMVFPSTSRNRSFEMKTEPVIVLPGQSVTGPP